MDKRYLGDSVYAAFDGYQIRLTTENGFGPSNEIFIEPEVLKALNRYYTEAISEPTEIHHTD